jgi:hypothetical protein
MVCNGPRTATTICGVAPTINNPTVLCPTASTTLYVPK